MSAAAGRASAAALVVADGATVAVRSAVRAAQACASSSAVDVLLLGRSSSADANAAAAWEGVSSVIVGGADQPLTAEYAAPIVQAQLGSGAYRHVVAASTTFGKNVLPRVAGVLGVSTVSDVIEVKEDGGGEVFVRPIYAGNALATVRSKESTILLTVRPTAFEPVAERSEGLAEVSSLAAPEEAGGGQSRWVGEDRTESSRPDLTAAGVVVAGGRGLKSGDNFKLLEEIADELGGAVGATRAAVDLGWVANDMQVGQTGKVVAPELYIGVGISGAIQHLAGMKDSKVIVAINKDEEAPIFQVADYGLVADLFDAVPQLQEKLKALPKKQ
ncbi:unnamed protein product [Chondrus crispus]|uniref:Electron transfer flavoprotein subunit alpha n=1 Tax=Chondrus crispus TaxID=2769 RepID=R7QFR7_CHOCR|nr:unnamed protein product [Chondrus crispus]CDF36598.1 unnamed protein product [Chondrus crispus]|eukprot:XP_005716417.1 unnamed protein product [Chondrus crispus]